ncbi:hypothetical protein, partial [Rhodoplanes roseus]|uniref:hypothetical protein n=1 Tax=Rhodoplanes roseus TaxID=29409 RepID=UPI0011B5E5AD
MTSATVKSRSPAARGIAAGLGVAVGLGLALALASADPGLAATRTQKLVCPKTLEEPGAFADSAEHAHYQACLRRAEARRVRAARQKQQQPPTAAGATAPAATATA